mmetsp:Transcript_51067/g.146605  ORF Transcript_51067/g.146605 Transcript_51067/m.146605 type:complete len:206 (-) Transcript_51067:1112-1729(-)
MAARMSPGFCSWRIFRSCSRALCIFQTSCCALGVNLASASVHLWLQRLASPFRRLFSPSSLRCSCSRALCIFQTSCCALGVNLASASVHLWLQRLASPFRRLFSPSSLRCSWASRALSACRASRPLSAWSWASLAFSAWSWQSRSLSSSTATLHRSSRASCSKPWCRSIFSLERANSPSSRKMRCSASFFEASLRCRSCCSSMFL